MIRQIDIGIDLGLGEDYDPLYVGPVLLVEPEMSFEDAEKLIRQETANYGKIPSDEFLTRLTAAYPQFFVKIESYHPVVLPRA